MHRLLALALAFACEVPLSASMLSPFRAVPSAPGIVLLRDQSDPPEGAELAEWVARLQPRRVSSKELPASLEGYHRFGPLFAWEWAPGSMTPAQADALRNWLAFGGLLLLPPEAFVSGPPDWLEPLMPAPADPTRALDACRRHGLGAVCRVDVDGGVDLALSHAQAARGHVLGISDSALEVALRSRQKRRNPAPPLFLFSSLYAVCVAWLSWLWFRKRGMEDRAWLGVLGLTVLFSAGAVGAGGLLAGGTRELQIAILHGAPDATRLRLTGWVSRFSAKRESWRSELPDGASTVQVLGLGRSALRGTRLEGRSEPGQTSGFAFAGERLMTGPMSLHIVDAGGASQVRWANDTGLDFDRLWVAGAAPDSGVVSRGGSSGTLDLGAPDGRSFLPPSDWTAEEASVVDAYLQGQSALCPDCAFLASTRPEPGPDGRKLLYLWSVAGKRPAP
ncbi:MAG: hypothetical protein HY553_19235 [Elusimicrobia bacterium]|nr:hypothetical protein [Elusimicrobiota bacterium]